MLQIQLSPVEAQDNSFRNPLALLSDCHRRIEMFFGRLLEVAEASRGEPMSNIRREIFETALHYFAAGAPLHTRDEEESLFPRLRALGSAKAAAALYAIESLESDHRAAQEAHDEIDRIGRTWLTKSVLPEPEADRLIGLLRDLRELYKDHIDVEDNQVFPLAGRLLAGDTLETVGREMAARRDLDFDRIPPVNRSAPSSIDRKPKSSTGGSGR